MSDETYSVCILIYSDIDIVVSLKQSFRSQYINISRHLAYEIVLLKSIFDSKRVTASDDALLEYSSLSPPTVNLTLNGYGFIGRSSHTHILICECVTLW